MYDPKPHGGIPVSAGVPPLIRWAGIAGLIGVFIVAGIVIGASRYAHVWPAIDATHIKLDAKP